MKKLVSALAVGIAMFGTVFAFAATLGLTSTNLGSGDATVESCDTSVAASYSTTYSSDLGTYVISTVDFDLNAGCAGEAMSVTLTGDGGSLPATITGTAASGTNHVDFTSNSIPASAVTGVHVVVTGPAGSSGG